MDSIEKNYGYIIAVVVTVVAAVVMKYGYDDYQDKETATKGMVMIAVAAVIALAAWWAAYSYSS